MGGVGLGEGGAEGCGVGGFWAAGFVAGEVDPGEWCGGGYAFEFEGVDGREGFWEERGERGVRLLLLFCGWGEEGVDEGLGGGAFGGGGVGVDVGEGVVDGGCEGHCCGVVWCFVGGLVDVWM